MTEGNYTRRKFLLKMAAGAAVGCDFREGFSSCACDKRSLIDSLSTHKLLLPTVHSYHHADYVGVLKIWKAGTRQNPWMPLCSRMRFLSLVVPSNSTLEGITSLVNVYRWLSFGVPIHLKMVPH